MILDGGRTYIIRTIKTGAIPHRMLKRGKHLKVLKQHYSY
jgi:hypothetical protein